jgi:hypothetical protein
LEEEVAIDTSNADKLVVANRKDVPKGVDSSYGSCDALGYGYVGGLVVAISGQRMPLCQSGKQRCILDLVEQALSCSRLFSLVAIMFLGSSLV